MPFNQFTPLPPLPPPAAPKPTPGTDFQDAQAESSGDFLSALEALDQHQSAIAGQVAQGQQDLGLLGNTLASGSDELDSLSTDISSVDFSGEISDALSFEDAASSAADDAAGFVPGPDFEFGSPSIDAPPEADQIASAGVDAVSTAASSFKLNPVLATFLKSIGKFALEVLKSLAKFLLEIPVWGWILAGLAILAVFLFHGADPRQVPASKTEQVFEACTDVFRLMFDHGWISKKTALSFIATLLVGMVQAEDQLEQKYHEVRPFQHAITNATKTINDQAQYLAQASEIIPTGFTLDEVMELMTHRFDVTPGHWYSDSIEEARTIVTHMLNQLMNPPSDAEAPVIVTPPTRIIRHGPPVAPRVPAGG